VRSDLEQMHDWFGIGVAGNFAGHLEQAGEAGDFTHVAAAAGAPKGLFPFYVAGHESFLSTFPLSCDTISLPDGEEVQIEPEVALACEVSYSADGKAEALWPFAFGAFNDCSIRRPGAGKISEKKNWGPCSKGVASDLIPLDGRDLVSATATHRIASFLRRDGQLHHYGVDSPLSGYSYYGERLLDWIVDRLANQRGAAENPLEPIGAYLRDAGLPKRALVAIGATRYTELGESTYLRAGDESIVAVYDSAETSPEGIGRSLEGGVSPLGASVLAQAVT
jgi:hypothetical protein